jgi:hypothetical protein
MQARSSCARLALHPALWWLGLITLVMAWLSLAMSAAHAHRLPDAAIIDGHDVQPRAYQFSGASGHPDITGSGARTIDQLYDLLLRNAQEACASPATPCSAT